MRRTAGITIASACFFVVIPTVVTMMFPNLGLVTGWIVIALSGLAGIIGLALGLWPSRRAIAAGVKNAYFPSRRGMKHESMQTFAGYLWLLGTAIMIIAGLVFLSSFVVKYFENNTMTAARTFVGAPARADPPHILQDGRVVIGVTPKYLRKLYSDNTSLKADNISREYIGKWIDISGPFGDVKSPRKRYEKGSDTPITVMIIEFDYNVSGISWVSMPFDAGKWGKYIELLVKGQIIYVRCQIEDTSSGLFGLHNCEFFDPETSEVISNVPGQTPEP